MEETSDVAASELGVAASAAAVDVVPLHDSEGEDAESTHNAMNSSEPKSNRPSFSETAAELSGGHHESEADTPVDASARTSADSVPAESGESKKTAASSATSPFLMSHKKHFLILTPSGKPVFSRWEDFGVDGLAVCALIRGLAAQCGDKLEWLVAGSSSESKQRALPVRIVVRVKSPNGLLLCAVSRTSEPSEYLVAQLDLLYQHILFHVTLPGLNRVLLSHSSFDLSGLLQGTEGEARGLVKLAGSDLSLLLNALRPCRLMSSYRRTAESALKELGAGLGAPFAVVTHRSWIVAAEGSLDPVDGLLLRNFALMRALQLREGGEIWTPLCLPRYNSSGHLHVYVASLDPVNDVTILVASLDSALERFHELSSRRQRMTERLEKSGVLASLRDPTFMGDSLKEWTNGSSLDRSVAAVVRVASPLRGSPQFHETNLPTERKARKRVLRRFAALRLGLAREVPHVPEEERVPDADVARVVWQSSATAAAVLAKFATGPQLASGEAAAVEVLALFPPLTLRSEAVEVVERLRTWVLKERDELFFN